MEARPQDLPFDPATLNRLSPGLIANHHQNNDGGAVQRLNANREELSSTLDVRSPCPTAPTAAPRR
jgi:superoxide dismutase, Fe-Mn family